MLYTQKHVEAVLVSFQRQPWALTDEAVLDSLLMAVGGVRRRPAGTGPRVRSGVAVVPLSGVIFPKPNLLTQYGFGTAVQTFRQQFRAALLSNAATVVIDVDSPGGAVALVDELSEEIFSARGQKPLIAIANPMMASAAYHIGTAADTVVVTPSGLIGSVGVFAQHTDISEAEAREGVKTTLISAGKYKTAGNPFEPLSAVARKYLQQQVNQAYARMVLRIAKNRGVRASQVRNGFGEGRVVGAQEAVSLGLADQVASMSHVLEQLGVATPTNRLVERATRTQRLAAVRGA